MDAQEKAKEYQKQVDREIAAMVTRLVKMGHIASGNENEIISGISEYIDSRLQQNPKEQ